MIKKLALILAAVVCLSGLFACGGNDAEKYGPNYRKELEDADQSYLYGMCYIAYEGFKWNNVDYKKSFELMHNLGVKSLRNWMHSGWLMSDPETMKESEVAIMKDILAEAAKYDIQIIGMNHHNFHDLTQPNGGQPTAKPRRDMSEGSYYLQWLADYETTWYTLVSAFPEVTYWEIDNELNNAEFMPCLEGGTFSQQQMADIATDMLFYASRGIHRANPDAITVMGGITETQGLGSGQNKRFLQLIYDNIASGEFGSTYPDDFFQCAAWHPYLTKNPEVEYFVQENQEIYDVILENEGKDKKVFLTEMGFSETAMSEDMKAQAIIDFYTAVKEEMPYVESMHYFRLYNDVRDFSWSGKVSAYGLFYDPDPSVEDKVTATGELAVPGRPKKGAFAFQQVAGGSGDLTLMQAAE